METLATRLLRIAQALVRPELWLYGAVAEEQERRGRQRRAAHASAASRRDDRERREEQSLADVRECRRKHPDASLRGIASRLLSEHTPALRDPDTPNPREKNIRALARRIRDAEARARRG